VTESAEEFLQSQLGGRFPAAQFPNKGGGVAGTIMGTPRVVDTQYGRRMIVDLDNPSGGVTLWVKEGTMGAAVSKAVADAGEKTLAEGGKLAVIYTDDKDTGKGNPLKMYEARYEPPAKGVDVGSIFDNLAGTG
jgi:hypothetical protein